MGWWALLALTVEKILVTSLTLQGGCSGGLFTPSLFVGASAGGALGVILRAFFPALPIAPESYAQSLGWERSPRALLARPSRAFCSPSK